MKAAGEPSPETRKRSVGRALAVIRTDWVWLAAAIVVAGVTMLGFVAFGVYEGGHREAATHAIMAELAASQINALEWQSIAEGQVSGDTSAAVSRLLADLRATATNQRAGSQSAAIRLALDKYELAIREEFSLIQAGTLDKARQIDEERVDPAYKKLRMRLRSVAIEDAAAADNARSFAIAGEIAVIVCGLTVASVMVWRFAHARRALAIAEIEQRALQETNQAKSEVISVVSHDLRNPLTSIIGYLELLREGEPGPASPGQQQLLAIIERNANRLLAIINDLLFISRAEEHRITLDLTAVDLAEIATEIVEAQQPRAVASQIDLRLMVSPAALISADLGRIEELIDNLLSNALKFTPPGGSVRVSVRQAGTRVQLEVSDTGAGISPSDRDRIFERFFRGPQAARKPGTGLGLAIVKAIADAHDATIDIYSSVGEGSTFRVEFPARGESSIGGG